MTQLSANECYWGVQRIWQSGRGATGERPDRAGDFDAVTARVMETHGPEKAAEYADALEALSKKIREAVTSA